MRIVRIVATVSLTAAMAVASACGTATEAQQATSNKHVAAGRLVAVLQEWSPAYPGLCLYYPSRRNIPARLRAFIDLVRQSK